MISDYINPNVILIAARMADGRLDELIFAPFDPRHQRRLARSPRTAAATTSTAIDTLADGRSVVKVRVPVIAEGGEAESRGQRQELLAWTLGVPKGNVRVLSGVTSSRGSSNLPSMAILRSSAKRCECSTVVKACWVCPMPLR